MSSESVREPAGSDGDEGPRVPEEVLEAIENLAEGHTATKDEIEAALKF